jgi:outer membrane protein TolC
VATRDEAVIVAQAQIETAQDTLRALVFNPSAPDFWTTRIEPADLPVFQPIPVDVDGVVRNALQTRTDLEQARKSIEATDINIRYFRNQSLPDVTASFNYGLTGLGGTQFLRGSGFPGPIIGQAQRSFGTVLGDLFGNQFPSWTAALNISYPLGRSAQEASLARARLLASQEQTQLRNAELQVVTAVRNVARQVLTNQKRVESTRVSRGLAEQRLDAEQRKLAGGHVDELHRVSRRKRDLAQARNNELSAILDYNRSLVDLETIQQAPLSGATGNVTAAVTTGAVTTGPTTIQTGTNATGTAATGATATGTAR